MPNLESHTIKEAVLYPTVEALTDDIFASEFSGDRPSDAEIKYEDLSEQITNLDLQWLIREMREKDPDAQIAIDPRVRTHLYLEKVAQRVQEDLGDMPGTSLRFDRHELHESFPDHEFVGTPLSYSDIGVVRHVGGYVLTSLGGGYAGNRVTSSAISGSTPLAIGLEGKYIPDKDTGDATVTVPLGKLVDIVAEAAEIAGLDTMSNVRKGLDEITKPCIPNDFDNYSWILRYTGLALPRNLEITTAAGRIAIVLRNLRTRIEKEEYTEALKFPRTGAMRDATVHEHVPDPRSAIDTSGNATYVVEQEYDERLPGETGFHFTMRSNRPIYDLDATTNKQFNQAVEYINSQVV